MFDPLHKWLAIPAAEQPPNDYRLLGVALFEDDADVIDAAADKHLAFLHHLSNGEYGEDAERIANQVSAARLRLINPERRAIYDQELRLKGVTSNPVKPDAANLVPDSTDPKQSDDSLDNRTPTDQTPVATPNTTPNPAPVTTGDSGSDGIPMASASAHSRDRHGKASSDAVRKPVAKRGRGTWLLTVLPGVVILCGLIVAIMMGKLRFDQERLEALNVPTDLAARLAGEPIPGGPDQASEASADPSSAMEVDDPNLVDGNSAVLAPGVITPRVVADNSETPPVESSGDSQAKNPGLGIPAANPLEPLSEYPSPEYASPKETAVAPQAAGSQAAGPFVPEVTNHQYSKPKIPMPSDEAIDAKMALVRDLYEQDYKDAKTKAAKIKLANAMRATGSKTLDDSAGQFALWRVARDICVAQNDFQTAFALIQLMSDRFDGVDELGQKAKVLQAIGQIDSDRVKDYVGAVLSLAQGSLDTGDFRRGKSLCIALRRSLRSRIPSGKIKTLQRLELEIGNAEQLSDRHEASVAVLKSDPDNADAHADVGKYLCFVRNRWSDGLVQLASGGEQEVCLAAKSELENSDKTDAVIQIADAWYDAVEAAVGPLEKRRLVDHTIQWYGLAKGNARGLDAVKITERLRELGPQQSVPAISSNQGRMAVSARAKVLNTLVWNSPESNYDFASVQGNVIKIGMGKNIAGYGEAAAGIEFSGVETITVVGAASHSLMTTASTYSKNGFVVDYRTAIGYSKRVFLGCGSRSPRFTVRPTWGTAKIPDFSTDLGVHQQYEIDLKRYAPSDWDGTCWFSVYMQNAGYERSLQATLGWK